MKCFVVTVLVLGSISMLGYCITHYDSRAVCMSIIAVNMLYSALYILKRSKAMNGKAKPIVTVPPSVGNR
jgi:hypothetical protein